MLNESELKEIITKAAQSQIGEDGLAGVECEPVIGMDGREVLRVVLVLTKLGDGRMHGRRALDMLVTVRRSLEEGNEERFPVVEYKIGGEDEDDGDEDAD
ncbi:MAG: hypothetical protein H7840_11815 [Alphaproteobacteria bacterium]